MDSLEKTIVELKKNVYRKTHEKDLTELERNHNGFKNELLMKRNQVDEMRNELHNSNLKIYELTQALDKSNSEKVEIEFNFKLTLKKLNYLEDKLRGKNENVMKYKMKQEIGASQSETLNAYAQKMALKNYDCIKKLDELETIRKNSLAFQQELINRDSKIKFAMTTLNGAFEKLQLEHKKILDLASKFNCSERSNELNQFLVTENNKLKTDKTIIEEKYIQTLAKCEQLEQIINKNRIVTEPNLFTKLIFLHWKKLTTHYKEQTESNKQIIEKFSLNNEKEVNIKLILQNEEFTTKNNELLRENEELKNKLKILENGIAIKNELDQE